MNYLNRRKKKKPMKIKSVMEHPLNEANFAYKKTRDEKLPQVEKPIDTSLIEKSKDTLPKENRKLVHDLDSLANEMEPSNEELEYRKSKMNSLNILIKCKQYLKCTRCNKNYEKAMSKNEKISVHPFLGVLMCEDCCDYYGDGNFSLDSDDEDKYCRWCGEGGKILSCSKCIYGFCSKCVKKHFGIKHLNDILKDDDWLCFFCNPKPLWHLRFVCSLAGEKSQASEVSSKKDSPPQISTPQIKRKQDEIDEDEPEGKTTSTFIRKTKRRRILVLNDNEESDQEHFDITKEKLKSLVGQSKKKESSSPKKSLKVKKLEKILEILDYHLSFGCNWTKKLMSKLNLPSSTMTDSDLFKECQKTKWFLSLMSSHLLEFCRAVESLESSPKKKKDNDNIDGVDQNKCGDLTSYSDILLFLNFVTNQVKSFMDKGISVQDLVQAEVVSDDTVLGIRRKKPSSSNCSEKAAHNKDGRDSAGGSSNLSLDKVVANDERGDCSQSTPETNGEEIEETMIFNKTMISQSGSEGKAKKLIKMSDETNANKENEMKSNKSVDNYEEILAILDDA